MWRVLLLSDIILMFVPFLKSFKVLGVCFWCEKCQNHIPKLNMMCFHREGRSNAHVKGDYQRIGDVMLRNMTSLKVTQLSGRSGLGLGLGSARSTCCQD